MREKADLLGQRFGKLVVISKSKEIGKGIRAFPKWNCICDCGECVVVFQSNLKRGHSTGCKACRDKANGPLRTTHGKSKTIAYNRWVQMIQRCTNPENEAYPNYGGRGITVCDRWLNSFEAYLEDVGECPGPEYSGDRYPDNNGNYGPGNFRWGTEEQQSRNKRTNRWIEYDGVKMILQDWSKYLNIPQPKLHRWLKTKSIGEIVKSKNG